MVILTSFKYADDFTGQKFSVALWNPKGVQMETLEWLTPVGAKGNELHLKDFKDPAKEYADEYKAGIAKRWSRVSTWLYGLDPDRTLVLCCWCPHSKSSQEELSRAGRFCCHTGLIGKIIRRHRPDIEVVLDFDREEGLNAEWRP